MTAASRCLDRKLLIGGYEVMDLFVIFATLSVLNLLFGNVGSSLLFIWVPTGFVALLLRLGKRGKPDGCILHWLRFQIRSGAYSAFKDDSSL